MIARIGRGLLADIEKATDADEAGGAEVTSARPVAGSPILSTRTGYIEALDEEALLAIATERNLVLTVVAIPGEFIHRGRPLLRVNPAGEDDLHACGDLFSISRKRSSLQDLRFAIDELVELAARALSPGVNDPFTAIACIDWLGAALSDLAAMPSRPSALQDEEGNLRVIVPRLVFADYLRTAIGQLRPYAVRDPNAAAHLLRTLEVVGGSIEDGRNRELVQCERERVRSEMRQHSEDAA